MPNAPARRGGHRWKIGSAAAVVALCALVSLGSLALALVGAHLAGQRAATLVAVEAAAAANPPPADPAAPVRAALWAGALLGLLVLALGLLAVGLAVRRVVGPLAVLAQEAEEIRHFEIGATPRPPIESPIAELDRLAGAMRAMQSALRLFHIYVPRDLARKLIAEGAEAKLGGDRRPLTIMFSDVQGFTTLAEGLDPDELMRITSTYFEALTTELLACDATIDKYIGDAVMAIWNAPRRDLAHAMHACHAALRARALTLRLAEEFAARGWPRLYTRFGLHTGEAVVGNVGSSDRMTYTAIGSMVNMAARLEGLNKHYGTQILVSEATRRGAGPAFVFRPVDLVLPKGTQEPTEIHELLGLAGTAREPGQAALVADPKVLAALPAWRAMVRHFRAGQFDEAAAALDAAGGAQAGPLATVFAERIAALRTSSPPPGWTPVIRFEQK